MSYLSQWSHSFTRLFIVLRAALWEKLDLLKLLACYGTAHNYQTSPRLQPRPNGKISKSHFTLKPHETLENQHANPMLFPLWEDSGLKYAIFALNNWNLWDIACKSMHRLVCSFSMKTRVSKKSGVQYPLRGRAGMTLVEVVVALAITGLMVAGIVTGYIFCTTSTVKDSLYMAANARAMERMEETRSAIWAPYRAQPTNQLVAANFPDKVVILDLSGSGSNITSATIKTDISQISLSPLVMRIRVDCIWQFKGVEWITNTIETCRAPDQ